MTEEREDICVVVVRELRAMVDGEGTLYRRFKFISPSIKKIWLAAAVLIDLHRPRK